MNIGHPEQQKMLKLIKWNYWQPEIKEDVKKYVQGYIKCQQNKVQYQKKPGELYLLKIPQGLWQEISIDIVGPLPKSNGNDAIVVIIDRFTKIIQLKATTTNISSEEIAKIYKDEIQKLYKVPRKVLSNRGPQFVSRFMEELMKALESKRMLSMGYYPQTDGQIERINQEVGTFL